MKAVTFKLSKNNKDNRDIVVKNINIVLSELAQDADFEVIIKNYDSSKSARQRRLDWRWNTEIARSGLGRHNDPTKVHLEGKWLFAKPLLLAGEDEYSLWIQDMWNIIHERYKDNAEKQRLFFVYAVHTEEMTRPMVSEYLKSKQYYWTNKGANLTDPSLAGLKEL